MNEKGKSTLGKFEKYLNLKGYSNNSIKMYVHYVSEFISSFNKSAIHLTIRDCEEYIYSYCFTSTSQQNQIYSSIKAYYKSVLKIDLSGKIFLERPRKEKKLPKILNKDHILSSINNIENSKHKAIIMIGASVGLRVSEVVNLKITDIDSKSMIIHIVNGKGRKDRIVPLSNSVLNVLRRYYLEYHPVTYLFNGQNNIKYSTNSCNKIVKRYLGGDCHYHLLRHFAASNLMEQDVNIRKIQSILGHSSSKTCEIYTHVLSSHLQNLPLAI